MKIRRSIAVAALACLPVPAQAERLDLPTNAVLVAERTSQNRPARFAIGPYEEGAVEFATADGVMTSQIWRIRDPIGSTSRIAEFFATQLQDKGYQILFDCRDEACGGYDFRYALDLVAEPVMHVDLGDFRFMTAQHPDTAEYLSVMISRSGAGGFVEIDSIADPDGISSPLSAATPPVGPAPTTVTPVPNQTDVAATLETNGWLSLDDLTFATGSSELSEGVYASLARLAPYLLAHPEIEVALVGHTDAQGSLAANIALSQRRAASVVARLVSVYGIPRRQMVAQGVGFLVPRWSNQSEDGRRKNRRVEVVLTSTP